MFANFSITSEGLTDTKPRPKPNALRIGCLTCRRKKKKCDAQKPKCGRCQNSYGQDICLWPEVGRHRRPRSRSRRLSSPPEQVCTSSSPVPESPQSECSEIVMSHQANHVARSRQGYDLGFSLEDLCPWSMPDAVLRISPDLSPRMMLNISLAFQNRVLCLENDPRNSIIMQSLPLALEHPPLLHAWIACSVIALSRSMPFWHEKAIQHYDSAVAGLSQALQVTKHSNDKWKRETVILLHLFEGFQSKSDESSLGKVHLRGAHELFSPLVNSSSPMAYHDALILEGYIMHTINNCLFQPDSTLPMSHISEALETLQQSLENAGLGLDWRTCPWIGFLGRDLVDIIYKVSWLARQQNLDRTDMQALNELNTSLSNWVVPAYHEDASSLTSHDLRPKRLVLLARTYWCACSYLTITLIHRNQPARTHEIHLIIDTKPLITEALELLNELRNYKDTINNHLWAVLVVGTAAQDTDMQEQIRDLLGQFERTFGIETVKRAERFLEKVWMNNDGIFGDRSVLGMMFF